MDIIKFQENLIDQIKEAQLKLGFAKETIRLYYPAASLCRLLNIECQSGKELVEELENGNEFKEEVKSNYQSVTDLINRRLLLKKLVNKSNSRYRVRVH